MIAVYKTNELVLGTRIEGKQRKLKTIPHTHVSLPALRHIGSFSGNSDDPRPCTPLYYGFFLGDFR